MATIHRFEDLKVWQLSRASAKAIYALSQQGTFSRDFELKNQISRSSGSVMDNIAEGFGRGGRAEFIQFLSYALGSNDEVKSQLYRALDRGHITHELFQRQYAEVDTITKMVIGFINYLKKTEHKGFKYNTTDKPFAVEEPLAIDYKLQTTNYKLNL